MPYYHVQLDEDDIVKAITENPDKLEGDNILHIDTYNLELIGTKYDRETSTFIPVQNDSSVIVSKLEFWNMFSIDSQVKLLAAAKTDVMVENFMMQYNMATEIDVKDPLITQGIGYLLGSNIITQQEADIVFNYDL